MDVMADSSHSNSQYSFASPRQQNFPLPKDTILYILNNCNSPEVLQKLQQACKYFFAKKKVIIVYDDNVFYSEDDEKTLLYYERNINDGDETKKYPLIYDKIGDKLQYWPTISLTIYSTSSRLPYSSILYQCNLKTLKIIYQTLNFEELSFLLNGGSIEELSLDMVKIYYNHSINPVPIDAILAKCPRIIDLSYMNVTDIFSVATMERLNAINFVNKLNKFTFGIFELENGKYEKARELLCQFIRKNVKPKEEDPSCVHVYLIAGFYRDEFKAYFEQNLQGWNVNTW